MERRFIYWKTSQAVNPYIKLYRPVNNIMASLAVVAGAFIAVGTGITGEWKNVLLAALVVFLFTGGGNALNDYVDRETDRRNHPERPIPSGKIGAKTALRLGILSLILPLPIGFFINAEAVLIIAMAEALMISYEFSFKKKGLPGNMEISILVGMLFLFGGASVGNAERTLIFSIMASFATFGREIVKDIEDMGGDTDRRTLPKRIGREKAGLVGAGAFMAAVSLSAIPYGRGFGIAYLAIVNVADIIFFYTAYLALTDAKKSQRTAKLAMLIGLIAFLAGSLQY